MRPEAGPDPGTVDGVEILTPSSRRSWKIQAWRIFRCCIRHLFFRQARIFRGIPGLATRPGPGTPQPLALPAPPTTPVAARHTMNAASITRQRTAPTQGLGAFANTAPPGYVAAATVGSGRFWTIVPSNQFLCCDVKEQGEPIRARGPGRWECRPVGRWRRTETNPTAMATPCPTSGEASGHSLLTAHPRSSARPKPDTVPTTTKRYGQLTRPDLIWFTPIAALMPDGRQPGTMCRLQTTSVALGRSRLSCRLNAPRTSSTGTAGVAGTGTGQEGLGRRSSLRTGTMSESSVRSWMWPASPMHGRFCRLTRGGESRVSVTVSV